MAQCYEIDGVRPVIHPTAFVHPTAVLIGDVIVGPGCYLAPLSCMRGDFGRLILEEGANLQDTCVVHGFPGTETTVEKNGHIGHGAVLHGCRVEENALVGMNAVVMDGAVIGKQAFVAASAFVRAGFIVPPRTVVGGTPAKILRELTDEEIAWKLEGTLDYQKLAIRSLTTMRPTTPLAEVEANRPSLDGGSSTPLYVSRKKG